MESVALSVPLTEEGVGLVTEQAERLTGPLLGIYGRSRKLLGYETIKVWVQSSPSGPLLNCYFQTRGSIADMRQATSSSAYPIDAEMNEVFEAATGVSWDEFANQDVRPLIDWSADPVTDEIAEQENDA